MKTVAYIDTSFLLSIIFEDENFEKSIANWNKTDIFFSSLLLDIETTINVFKYCIKYKKDKNLYIQKTTESKQLLESINRKIMDQEVLLEIQNVDKLKELKSLDSIHIATANILKKINQDDIVLYTYDKNMEKMGKSLGMKIII